VSGYNYSVVNGNYKLSFLLFKQKSNYIYIYIYIIIYIDQTTIYSQYYFEIGMLTVFISWYLQAKKKCEQNRCIKYLVF
jgi:hypothetical protein